MDRARKAFFKIKQLDPRDDVILTIKLFDSLVKPILSYGSEVWGIIAMGHLVVNNFKKACENLPVEKLNLCKYVLGVNRKTTNDAVRGELGRYPLLIDILSQTVRYYERIKTLENESLVKLSYLDSIQTNYKSSWTSCIQTVYSEFSPNILESMKSKYQEEWSIAVRNSRKLRTYNTFKKYFAMENYIIQNKLSYRRNFSKLRVSAHKLAIETGRYSKKPIPEEERLCIFCNRNDIENEYHFVMVCPYYTNHRNDFIQKLENITTISFDTSETIFLQIMNYLQGDTEVAHEVCKYIDNCFQKRQVSKS